MRQISMNLIEAIYFIFFLPLSAVENEEISSLVLLTTTSSVFAMINLSFFSLLFVFKHKSEKWKVDVELKGYWVEVKEPQEYEQANNLRRSIKDYDPKAKRHDFVKGDLANFESKVYRLLANPHETDSLTGLDAIIFVGDAYGRS